MICVKCNDTGIILTKVFEGAFLYRPCECEVAAENKANADKEIKDLLEQLKS